jgi:hypothetical protein
VPRSDAARARTPRNVGANLAAGSPPFLTAGQPDCLARVHAFLADRDALPWTRVVWPEMSSAWPPAWLAAAAHAEQWNPATLPQIRASLYRLGGAELERRGQEVCVVGGHCEPIEVGPSLPMLAAMERLVAGERTRRNDERKSAEPV